jgi:hypothetical protein
LLLKKFLVNKFGMRIRRWLVPPQPSPHPLQNGTYPLHKKHTTQKTIQHFKNVNFAGINVPQWCNDT